MATWTNCICPHIQQALNDIAGRNAPAMLRDKVGALEFLMSPQNRSGFEQIRVDHRNGKFKQVDVNYITRKTEAWINTSCSDTCDTGREPEPSCETVYVNNCYESDNLVFDEDNMRRLCAPLGERDSEWIAMQIQSLMNALMTQIDKAVLTQIGGNFGVFLDGRAKHYIQLFNSYNRQYANMDGARQFAVSRMIDEIDEAGYSGMPAAIGHGDLSLYFRALGIGAVNLMGADLAQLRNDIMFYHDRFVQGQIGQDEFIVMVPGVCQFLEWDKYVGDYAKKSNTFEHGTIVDPVTGMTFDLKMHYNDCNDTYYIKLQKNWDIWFLPDDSFIESDDLYGVNGIYNYEVCDRLTDCEGESDSSVSEPNPLP